MSLWVVILLGHRNPADIDGGLRVAHGETAEEALREAHEIPPSIFSVKNAWICELVEPYNPTLVPVAVPKPEWGKARPAMKGQTR